MSLNKSISKITGTELLEHLKSEKKKLISEKHLMDKKDNHIYPIKEELFNIPENWVWCYLSDISIIQEGPGIRKHQYCNEGIQFLTVTNILEGEVDLEKSKKYISIDEYQKVYKHFTINYGDIVTACSGGSWGKSAIYELNEKLILNTSTLRLRFFNDLGSNKYLYYLTKTTFFKDSLNSHLTGQQPNYGYSHYSKIQIPLPPLPEQQSIVAILDESFAAIAKAKANAEQNLKNVKELFESYLQGVFEKKGEGWAEKTLGEVCCSKSSNVSQNQLTDEVGDYPIFGASGLIKNVSFYHRDKPYLSIVKDGSGFGRITKMDAFTSVIGTLQYILPNDDIDLDYLNYSLMSVDFKKYVQGAAIPHIYFKDYKNEPFLWMPLQEQKNIVQKLDALSAEIKKLEAIYNQKINDLEELKKSFLQKAFSGELKTAKALV
jgi:type I restriction enzyme S subunit